MPEKNLDEVLSGFTENDYTVKIINTITGQLPGAPEFTFYNDLEGATLRLADGDPSILKRAQEIAEEPNTKQALWVMYAIDKADMGVSVYSGLKGLMSIFSGRKKLSYESDPEQALDATVKAAAMGYLIHSLFSGGVKDKIKVFQSLPAGREMALYFALCEVTIPFADNVAMGGASLVGKIFSSQKSGMTRKLGGLLGGDKTKNATMMLDAFSEPLGKTVDEVQGHSASLTKKISGFLPSGAALANFVDSGSGLAASGLDAMPVWGFLGGRLVAEACVHRAKEATPLSSAE